MCVTRNTFQKIVCITFIKSVFKCEYMYKPILETNFHKNSSERMYNYKCNEIQRQTIVSRSYTNKLIQICNNFNSFVISVFEKFKVDKK